MKGVHGHYLNELCTFLSGVQVSPTLRAHFILGARTISNVVILDVTFVELE